MASKASTSDSSPRFYAIGAAAVSLPAEPVEDVPRDPLDEQVVAAEAVHPLGRAAVEHRPLALGEGDHGRRAVAVLLEPRRRHRALELTDDRLQVPLVPHHLALARRPLPE